MDTDRDADRDRASTSSPPPAVTTAPRAAGWLWGTAAVLVVVVAGLLPLLFVPHYYWRGDTQIGYFGAYYHLGQEIRQGHFPLMEPWAWRGGNHIVEGDFGLLSPILITIGIGASLARNAIVYMTVVKLVFLAVAAAGGFLVARSYGVARPLAFVVGVLVPLSGFTMYLDAPTWLPGLVVSGLLAIVWWALRGCLLHGRNPVLPLLFGELLASMGYVFGTGMLAVVVVACIVDALLARRFRAAVKGLVLGILIGIPAAVVRLPFVLSSAVTGKSSGGVHAGKGMTDLGEVLRGMLPTNGIGAPLFYLSWLLPFLVFVDWRKVRRSSSDLVGLLLVSVVAVVWAFAPSYIGPLRYPMRLMPYVVLCTVLLGVIGFSRARFQHLSGRRLLLALFVTGLMGYITVTAQPDHWREQAAVTALVGVGLTGLWLLLRVASGTMPRPSPRWAGAAAAFVGLWTVLVVGVQHHYQPETYAVDRGMPGDITKYLGQFPAAVGDIFMVGHVDADVEPGSVPKPLILIANSWYVSGLPINNVHANTGNRAFTHRYCTNYLGFTCRGALDTLLSKEPHTGLPRVDLLSVSSIALLKSDVSTKTASHPPSGWHVAGEDQMSVTWVRDKPLPTAGGVVWSSDGVQVSEISRDDESARLQVGTVPTGGGEVILSRIDWPGYQVSNAAIADPVDGYLLTLHVTPADSGKEIDVRYAPPHWTLLLTSLAVGAAASLLWSIAAAVAPVVRRRNRSG